MADKMNQNQDQESRTSSSSSSSEALLCGMVSFSSICRACKSFFTKKHHHSKREPDPPSPPSDPQPYDHDHDHDQDQITYIDRQRKAKEEKKYSNSPRNENENESSRKNRLLNSGSSMLSRSTSTTTHSRNEPSFSRSRSQTQRSKSGPIGTLLKSMSKRHTDPPDPLSSLSRSTSRTGHNPIMYSNSTGLIRPPDMEKQLECTLDELCFPCTKKITITRDVVKDNGQIVEEDIELTIKVKPGWTKGTKIKFDEKGNETPGTKAADLNIIIAEKTHHLFTREGDHDLRLHREVTLKEALTGCTLSIPILGGETTSVKIDDIIYPGFEKVIEGQGMPFPKEKGRRGNLIVQFTVKFPEKLTVEQRLEAYRILELSFFSS